MFFSQSITAIKKGDRVLEIGPGSSPHPRSDDFLELSYSNEADRLAQRGYTKHEPALSGRRLHHYDGGRFPFVDREFDYCICSHVVEHVPDVPAFVEQINRICSRGYLEFPLATYEHLYGFEVHRNYVRFDPESETLLYLPKCFDALAPFDPIHAAFRSALEVGLDDMLVRHPGFFFQGFEFETPLRTRLATGLDELLPSLSTVKRQTLASRVARRILR